LELELILIYLAFGIIGGLLSGLLGVGGGIIFIPVFDHLFRSLGIEGEELVRFILANSFLAILFAGMFSGLKHMRMGNFHLREVLTIAIPATITGSVLSQVITSALWYKEIYFKIVFIAVILVTLWRTWVSIRRKEVREEIEYRPKTYASIGAATGLISAVSGLGGGIVMIPLLTMLGKLDIKKASAISISVIPIMILPFLVVYALGEPTTLYSYSLGYMQFQFILPIVAGVFLGSPFGVRMGQRMKSVHLQLIFSVLLIIIVARYLHEVISQSLV
jgi:uncharacterized protein